MDFEAWSSNSMVNRRGSTVTAGACARAGVQMNADASGGEVARTLESVPVGAAGELG